MELQEIYLVSSILNYGHYIYVLMCLCVYA